MLTRSTTKQIRNFKSESSEVKFSNPVKVVCDWIDCWTIAIVGGRGVAKSSEIQADRTLRVVEDMPGAPLAFVCDTYVNLQTNIMPAVKMGWKRKHYYEDIHYVCNKRPPDEWLLKCSVIVDDFRHTIFFSNGTVIFGGSLDRPSLLAGKSVCHMFLDEAKFQENKKVDRAFPILRGDATVYGHSTYFLGMTVTTDMPDVSAGEFDWIFRFAKKMDVSRIGLILKAFNRLNVVRLKLYKEANGLNREKEIERLSREMDKWEALVHKVRHEQTFFLNVSSLANIDILTLKYLKRLTETLEPHEFNKSVLGMRPTLKRQLRFYTNLNAGHFYNDGINYAYADKYGYQEGVKVDSRWLRYVNHNQKLEAGFDTGNMKSLVVAQDFSTDYRLLKFFYTLPPLSFSALGADFVEFFKHHQKKELDLYYDRAANAYGAMGEDAASALKNAIEKDANGNRTGWMVNLMSLKQPNIPMEVEYEFMLKLMEGKTQGLPRLLIDSEMCKPVKSSLEKAPAKITYKGNKKIVGKEKKSEKISPERLPMESTNPSDAFKYLMCRQKWLAIANPRKVRNIVGASIK